MSVLAIGVSALLVAQESVDSSTEEPEIESAETEVSTPAANPTGWRMAAPGKTYEFPADHLSHPDFKTEWWYFTGNLKTTEGRRLGYQITWFRQGIRPPSEAGTAESSFVLDHLYFGHIAISDLKDETFKFGQIIRRGAHGETGAAELVSGEPVPKEFEGKLVWIEPWDLTLTAEGGLLIQAESEGIVLDLHLEPTRTPIFHGKDGFSQKAEGKGNGSHYYSFTRLKTTGSVAIGDTIYNDVTGSSWFDREWSTSVLGERQIGWDWFSLNLSDGSDLMLYQLREADGSASSFSKGTLRKKDGTRIRIGEGDFELEPIETWTSEATGGEYPIKWALKIPEQDIDLTVSAAFSEQELVLFPVTYWEGAVRVEGTQTGEGYMELTGYTGEVPLQ